MHVDNLPHFGLSRYVCDDILLRPRPWQANYFEPYLIYSPANLCILLGLVNCICTWM